MKIDILLWKEKGAWWAFSPQTHVVAGEKREWSGYRSDLRKELVIGKVRGALLSSRGHSGVVDAGSVSLVIVERDGED